MLLDYTESILVMSLNECFFDVASGGQNSLKSGAGASRGPQKGFDFDELTPVPWALRLMPTISVRGQKTIQEEICHAWGHL